MVCLLGRLGLDAQIGLAATRFSNERDEATQLREAECKTFRTQLFEQPEGGQLRMLGHALNDERLERIEPRGARDRRARGCILAHCTAHDGEALGVGDTQNQGTIRDVPIRPDTAEIGRAHV